MNSGWDDHWNWPIVILGLLYWINVLWWEPRQEEKMRRTQEKRAMEALRLWLSKGRR
jgi:hypothetical protein